MLVALQRTSDNFYVGSNGYLPYGASTPDIQFGMTRLPSQAKLFNHEEAVPKGYVQMRIRFNSETGNTWAVPR